METIQNYLVNSKDYVILKKINGGGFGAVYKVQNKVTNEILAAKVAIGGSQNRMINREIKIMIHFDHPTIEKLRGYSNKDFYDNKIPTIFMNFEANGSLRDAIEKSHKGLALENYDNTARQIILIGIARGMMILHKNNVIHRDLKPENILLDENLHPLITDFGLSKFFELGHSMSQSMNPGTCFYMAPEIISNERFDTKADVYSFGILMYEVITEDHPYPSLKNKNFITALPLLKDGKLRPKFDKYIKKSFHKLLESCLSTDPKERPTFEDIYLKLAYNFDDFIADDDDDENENDEDKYFLPDVDKEKVDDYIKEIEEEKSDGKLEKIEKSLIKLQADFEETKKENILLRKENQEIKKKYDSLKSKFTEEITSIKHDISKLKKINKESQLRLNSIEDNSKSANIKCDKLFEDVKKFKEISSTKSNTQKSIQDEQNNEKDLFSKVDSNFDDFICNIGWEEDSPLYESFLINPNDYKQIECINKSRCGSTFLAEKKHATKFVIYESSKGNINSFFNEVKLFIQIRAHPCICKFFGFAISNTQIILEYLENGSLETIFDKLSRNEKVDYWNGTVKSKTVFGIAAALIHLQNQKAFHRNLTPSCILFDSNYEPRITNFAESQSDTDKNVQTPKMKRSNIYQAPEVSSPYCDYNCDNFSYGVILYQIVTGKKPYDLQNVIRMDKEKENKSRPPLPVDISPKLSPMIGDLWDCEPQNRPELIDIIKALIDCDQPLFPDTDMNEYKKYRDRVIRSTFLTKEQIDYLKHPSFTEEYNEIFENHLDSAEKGSVIDMVKVANYYEKGYGPFQDLEESIKWYSKAAEKKNPEAIYKLAYYYKIGCPTFPPDPKKYISYLIQARNLKYPQAIVDYAVLQITGEYGVKQDCEKAEQILKKMADKPINNGEAQYLLAKFYRTKRDKDIEQVIKYFNMARENGVEGAICDYALMLLQGNDVQGIKILNEAADKGFPMANYNLGEIYKKGLYMQPKDLKKALYHYKIAADKGIVKAIVIVAKSLFTGKFDDLDCENDPIQAARLFEYAAAYNDPEGLFWWATFLNNYDEENNLITIDLYIKYGGTPNNLSLALKFYEKSAKAGFVPSMLRLAKFYNMDGMQKNPDLAKDFIQMAVNHGSKEAVALLELMDK